MPDGREPLRVLVFSASLRAGSLNTRLATLAADVIRRAGAEADEASMADFDAPSFDGDVEESVGFPPGAQTFLQRLQDSDAFVVCSPEYNASMPGGLKNAVDWVSRFRPQPFHQRHGLLLSASPSMVGGNRSLWALRVPFEHLGARMYPDMFSLAQAHEAMAPDGSVIDSTLRKRFESTLDCFLDFVEASRHYPAMKKQWVEFLGERPNIATERIELSPAEAA